MRGYNGESVSGARRAPFRYTYLRIKLLRSMQSEVYSGFKFSITEIGDHAVTGYKKCVYF